MKIFPHENTVQPALNHQKHLQYWLFLCCILLLLMITLGGITRLTGSGLSIVEWKPITGIIPPLNTADWQAEFANYQQYPEYKYKNTHLDLDGFKAIYWLEYAHRLLGRMIGLVFILPLLFFAWAGYLQRPLIKTLFFLFILGGVQGLLGWYMVKSGLIHNPQVSQYRLTAHLSLAVFIITSLFWLALNQRQHATSPPHPLCRLAWTVNGFIFLTLIAGALVAGLKAGFIHNTFPKMDGHWIPPNLYALTPYWKNAFENPTTAQFNHRFLALITLSVILFFTGRGLINSQLRDLRTGFIGLALLALLQVSLGIGTLLLKVPVALAAWHQGNAILLLLWSLWITHRLRYR